MGSLLHGIEISKTGGVTCFINMYAVYAELPPHLKEKVEGRRACHDFDKLSRIAHAKKATSEEREAIGQQMTVVLWTTDALCISSPS